MLNNVGMIIFITITCLIAIGGIVGAIFMILSFDDYFYKCKDKTFKKLYPNEYEKLWNFFNQRDKILIEINKLNQQDTQKIKELEKQMYNLYTKDIEDIHKKYTSYTQKIPFDKITIYHY